MEIEEPTDGRQFIDRQIEFNKDVTRASQSMLQGLTRQGQLNEALAQQLRDQDSRIKTIRDVSTFLVAMAVINFIFSVIGFMVVAR